MHPRTLRWALLACAVLVSGVLVARAFNPAPHSGGDNSTYVSLAYGLLTTGTYTEVFDPAGLPHTKYPPVFPLLLAALIALGAHSWVALKSTAVVATLLAVGFTYLWAERRVGPRAALAVAVLFGSSAGVVYYSHWILSDPVFVALTVASFWALEASGSQEPRRAWWLAGGVLLAGLAYFTRSAGLPLVVAIIGWLALRRRWRPAGFTAVALGVPALLWWWRGRGAPASYAAEFWLVDPYQPTLGRIELIDLLPRAVANAIGYVTRHGPAGIVGPGGGGLALLGVVLTIAALYGWARTVRERVGPVEIFFPLYGGLILVWPEVWSGDRFALPLYPLVFLYGALALRDVCARLPGFAAAPVAALALLAILIPAGRSWLDASSESRACAAVVAQNGPFSCYGPGVMAFAEAAAWSGVALPEGASVLTRKPTHFYVLGGVPSRTFPFDPDPAVQLALADELGSRYVLLDEWDGLAGRNVGAAVVRRPGAFCFVRAFGQPGAGGAQLLGILPPELRSDEAPASASEVRIGLCPSGYASDPAHDTYASSSSAVVPLLDGLVP
jgi:4-amino-4-deoxy-L-arabinose transferase-like glycosyltransferase